ncbi:MAG: hypothetical protein M0C28_39190 [Candidatus Moduliflexus flocculans]|nr:hypothetical protein [Candidatus Moduliflexus flocculans]
MTEPVGRGRRHRRRLRARPRRKAVELAGGMEVFVPKRAKVALLPNVQSRHPGSFTKPGILRDDHPALQEGRGGGGQLPQLADGQAVGGHRAQGRPRRGGGRPQDLREGRVALQGRSRPGRAVP